MMQLRPAGQAEMSGTYLSHLTAVFAAQAALGEYGKAGFYEKLDAMGEYFYGEFQRLIDKRGVKLRLQHVGPRFGLYFGIDSKQPVRNYRDAAQQNNAQLLAFVRGVIQRGVYFHVSAHHGISAAHNEADLDTALAAIDGALAEL
jgi:glutamate-1-semialdehyde 2,1-aminomutase